MRTAPGTAPLTKGGRAPGAARRDRAGGRAGAGPAAPEGQPLSPGTARPGPAAGRGAGRRRMPRLQPVGDAPVWQGWPGAGMGCARGSYKNRNRKAPQNTPPPCFGGRGVNTPPPPANKCRCLPRQRPSPAARSRDQSLGRQEPKAMPSSPPRHRRRNVRIPPRGEPLISKTTTTEKKKKSAPPQTKPVPLPPPPPRPETRPRRG